MAKGKKPSKLRARRRKLLTPPVAPRELPGMPPGLLPPPATGGRSAPDRSVRKEAGERGAAKGRPAVAAGGAERDWGAVRRG